MVGSTPARVPVGPVLNWWSSWRAGRRRRGGEGEGEERVGGESGRRG